MDQVEVLSILVFVVVFASIGEISVKFVIVVSFTCEICVNIPALRVAARRLEQVEAEEDPRGRCSDGVRFRLLWTKKKRGEQKEKTRQTILKRLIDSP